MSNDAVAVARHGGLLRMLNVRMKVGEAASRVEDSICAAPTLVRKNPN